MLRAGSEFFSIDAFGLTSSVAVARAGAGLPDSLEELESLLAERVGVFLAALLLLVAAAAAWRERLERSESSWSLSA